jgi:hypothetical protein
MRTNKIIYPPRISGGCYFTVLSDFTYRKIKAYFTAGEINKIGASQPARFVKTYNFHSSVHLPVNQQKYCNTYRAMT